MKTIVVYKSKTGYTKAYAHWIGQALNCQIMTLKESRKVDLSSYDYIIHGGSLYASGVLGLKEVIKRSGHKSIIVFAVGATPSIEGLEEDLTEKNNLKGNNLKLFYLRGGFNFSRLNSLDRLLMKLMKRKIERKNDKDLSPDERGMLGAFRRPVDFTNKDKIQPLIDYVHSKFKEN